MLIFFADIVMTAKERSLELCSGGEEEEYLEVEIHSPTDSSEDSVEVKVSPICLRNKRKCTEPRKVQELYAAPPKKRMCFKTSTNISTDNPEPFRPWNAASHRPPSPSSKETVNYPSSSIPSPEPKFLIPQPLQSTQNQPLPLIKRNLVNLKERKTNNTTQIKLECSSSSSTSSANVTPPCDSLNLRVPPLHPHLAPLGAVDADGYLLKSSEVFSNLQPIPQTKIEEQESSARKEQRNYKNMTRERRIEANARERTRVHTISAAFETLRRAVPAYSHNQKLSKLSVLRIACSYIMTLSNIVESSDDNELDGSSDLSECVENVTKTIQKEGKLRKKKDETD